MVKPIEMVDDPEEISYYLESEFTGINFHGKRNYYVISFNRLTVERIRYDFDGRREARKFLKPRKKYKCEYERPWKEK